MPLGERSKTSDMEKTKTKGASDGRHSFIMRRIFRCLMEEGYYPRYEETHILFSLDDNTAVVEYEEGVIAVRLFFSIDEEAYGLFLEASNEVMLETYIVKPVVLNDMKNIMFSFEMMCDSMRELKRYFSRGIRLLQESLTLHRLEMKKLILTERMSSPAATAGEDIPVISSKGRKPLS